ncbi:MAG TPA: sialidase family protein [Opitutaceae bacterium]|jgi:photosystem II stability/assembly factor-like uncharacterized protein
MTSLRTAPLLGLLLLAPPLRAAIPAAEPYEYHNVAIGGGGFVTGIVFSPAQRGLVYLRTDVGGAYRLDPSSDRWIPLIDWAGQAEWNLYGIESLAADPADPRRVYAAAGTYTNPSAGPAELLRSDDSGATWQHAVMPFGFGGNENGRNNGERLAVDPNDGRVLLLGTRTAGLWRSSDFGATWARVDSFPAYDDAMPKPASNGPRSYVPQKVGINVVRFDRSSGAKGTPTPLVYACVSTTNASVFRSTDAGKIWQALPGQPLGLRPTRTALASDGTLYVSYGLEAGPNSMTSGAVWKYEPGRGSWTDVTPEKPSDSVHFGYGSVAVDPSNPDTVLAGTWNHYAPLDEIFRSTDGGKSWVPILGDATWDSAGSPYTATMNRHWIADVEIDPFDPGHAILTTGFGIWATHQLRNADVGKAASWAFEDRGIEETVPLALASPPEGAHLISGLGDIDGFRHDDLSVSPARRLGGPPYKNTARIAFAWGKPAVMVRSGNTYHNDQVTASYSVDGGASWKPFVSEPPGTKGPFGRGEGAIAISPDGRRVVWSPTAVAPHFTTDWGATWYPCVGGTVNLAVAADTVNPSRFYGYDTEAGTLVASRDGARSFRAMGGGLPTARGRFGPAPGRLAAVPGREGEFFFVAGGALFRSRDGGVTVTASPGVEAAAFGFGKGAAAHGQPAVFLAGRVGGQEGIFRSDDAGGSWVRISDAAHGFGEIRVIAGDPRIFGRVYIGTGGRGIFYGDRVSSRGN